MYRIALVMIARNEARCIARCLRSAKPWVDEMIVMDTGSSDDTVALAQAEGAQVHRMAWPDDFAAARNAALACSTADWNLILDADETLASGGELIAALRQRPPHFIGRIDVRSQYDSDGHAQTASSWLPRILPRAVRYAGRIHEQPVSELPRIDLAITVAHDGYMPQQMAIKGPRNQALLEAAVAEQPGNAYLLYQLGKDHEVHDRFEAACTAYAQACALCEAGQPFRHDLVIRFLFALKQAGRAEEAIQLAEEEMPNWEHSPDFFFTLGDVLLSHASANPEQAEALLPMIESCWLRCLDLGERPELEGAVRGRGSHLAAHNLVVFYESLGQMDKARPYRNAYGLAKGPGRA